MNKIELLAPAKDAEGGIAAINCGADAVYIGASKFGARESAGNELEDIATLVEHAHKYWAKVYVTVNTLLRDSEIPEALELIARLYDLGVDGLIIQDTGLLECDLPPIPIIASTQMFINTPEKAAFIEKLGVKRAILPRELDLKQIDAIHKSTNMELEFFVHGSICVCYSGQCYLSYGLGGRSGNRGQCAQPCRKLYSLFDANGKALVRNRHLLSLKDLNLSDHLSEMMDAGISSFKIEGRLKDKAYVSNVVAYYRTKLDEILAERELQKSSSGTSVLDFTPNPEKTFNRRFTTHFLNGRTEKVGSIETPKMIGERIGEVLFYGKYEFTVDTKVPMHPGDGICWFDAKGELHGTVINAVRGTTLVPDKPEGIVKGVIIFRNHDHDFTGALTKSRAHRDISISLKLTETPEGLALTAVDEDGNSAEVQIACEKVPAQKPEQALENIRKQIQKTGGTIFTCANAEIEMAEVRFLPMSLLNSLRRDTLDKLVAVREENRPRYSGEIVKNDTPYPEEQLYFRGNVLNHQAEAFYRRHGVTKIEPAAESGLDLHGRKVMTMRYCIKHQLDLCPRQGSKLRPAEPLSLIDESGNKLDLRFDCAKCEMEVHLAKRNP